MWPPKCGTPTNSKMYVCMYVCMNTFFLLKLHTYINTVTYIHTYIHTVVTNTHTWCYCNQISRLCQDSSLERQIHEMLSKL